ncbi:hypothetical protein NMY22_g13927 [Coprinellus aureogranulatus]|nr:hypothetical protein NMY22_g13927 [Coprinellus aureogranulatus]
MLLLSLRHALVFVATLFLAKLTFAYPISTRFFDDTELVERGEGFEELSLYGRDAVLDSESLSLRDLLKDIDVYTRAPESFEPFDDADLEARANHPIKVTSKAKNDIKAMLPAGHSRQDYKNAKNWHRQQMQSYMAAKGATHATILRGAHSGGTNPNERAHITASMRNNNGKVITSSHRGANGKVKKSNSHHVYTSGHPPKGRVPHVP